MPKKANTTLIQVIQKSLEDYDFFKAITDDAKKTLKKENMSLKSKDMKLFKEMLAEKQTLTGREFIEIAHLLKDGRIIKRFPTWGGTGQLF